jgi:hypothetical protein
MAIKQSPPRRRSSEGVASQQSSARTGHTSVEPGTERRLGEGERQAAEAARQSPTRHPGW